MKVHREVLLSVHIGNDVQGQIKLLRVRGALKRDQRLMNRCSKDPAPDRLSCSRLAPQNEIAERMPGMIGSLVEICRIFQLVRDHVVLRDHRNQRFLLSGIDAFRIRVIFPGKRSRRSLLLSRHLDLLKTLAHEPAHVAMDGVLRKFILL